MTIEELKKGYVNEVNYQKHSKLNSELIIRRDN